ncbi:ROK family transcriptional regulator [Sphingobacterium tabacisoli]|uniref:ROK family protein n=1 Tax=Sphingobacterium tabacisoli TaxID=2044855 RepID=A0ABW5LA75_9SPHI|nr:ROK family transcriptional regulator [Sphingobacterium tabacisoli]
MKTLNQAILTALYYHTPQSIAELSNTIGKSVPNITRSVQELLKDNLINSDGLAPSTGGRRAIHYSLNIPVLPNLLAIAIDQYNTSISLLDLSNHIIKELEQSPIHLDQSENPVQEILLLIDRFLEGQDKENILTVGISMPGFVDSEKGINTSYSSTHPLYSIKNTVEKHLQLPTYIENDSTAIAIAEHQFGKAKGSNNALVINLNWGVGLGMILEGKLFKGHSGYAGEFSHIPLSNQNKLCSCGKRGCLEVEASLIAALGHASEQIENGQISQLTANYGQVGRIDIDQLIGAALNGDQVAIESFAKIGYMLGKGIATLIHIINPEKVIISGKGSEIGQILLPQIQASMLEFSIQRLSKDTTIEISTLHNAQIIGTASVAVSSSSWEITHKKNTKTN